MSYREINVGLTLVYRLRRWTNRNVKPTLIPRYLPEDMVFDAGPTLKQNKVIVQCLLWLPYGWRFIPRKATTQITRYIGPIVK